MEDCGRAEVVGCGRPPDRARERMCTRRPAGESAGVGADHRIVLPASALFGAAFLVLCDLVARTVMAPLEIPVGVVTALIGGPFFLWLLVRKS